MGHFLHPNRSKSQPAAQSAASTIMSPQHLTSEAVAALPPPGLAGPTNLVFSPRNQNEPSGRYLAFVSSSASSRNKSTTSVTAASATSSRPPGSSGSSSSSSSERQLFVLDMHQFVLPPSTASTMCPPPHPIIPIFNDISSSDNSNNNLNPKQLPRPLLKISTTTTSNSDNMAQNMNNRGATTKRRLNEQHPVVATATSMLSSSFPASMVSSSNCSTSTAITTADNPTHPAAPGSTASPSLPRSEALSLEERLRRERQRIHASSSSLVQFSWTYRKSYNQHWCNTQQYPHYSNQQQSPADDVVSSSQPNLRLLVPVRGCLYVQQGILEHAQPLQLVYDKAVHALERQRQQQQTQLDGDNTSSSPAVKTNPTGGGDAIDPQLSPDGRMIAFCVAGDIYLVSAEPSATPSSVIQLTFGATDTISHGLADFVAQEEMDRYRGFWWHPDSHGILFARLDESNVPTYRIVHQDSSSSSAAAMGNNSHHNNINAGEGTMMGTTTTTTSHCGNSSTNASYEDHRYPFAGKENPCVKLGYIKVDYESYFHDHASTSDHSTSVDGHRCRYGDEEHREEAPETAIASPEQVAVQAWHAVQWYESPREAPEYLARVSWLPDGAACAQWQNRSQNALVLMRMDFRTRKARTLLVERSHLWINLHHMMRALPRPIHPDECDGIDQRNIPPIPHPLPEGSCSFLFASERTGFSHLYLYTFVPGINGEQAIFLRALSGEDWMVESIVGVDMDHDVVYVTGTYDSVLERHLYALPITNRPRGAAADGIGLHGSDASHDNDHPMSSSAGVPATYSSSFPDSGHHSDTTPNGVRRGLKQVMNALSGKARLRNNSQNSDSASSSSSKPIRLTLEGGMHSVVMDEACRLFVDTSSDLDRPTTVKVFQIQNTDEPVSSTTNGSTVMTPVSSFFSHQTDAQFVKPRLVFTLYDALHDEKSMSALNSGGTAASVASGDTIICRRLTENLPAPELLSFPTSDGSETLHAALYRPEPRVHGPGPYPLICAVYGGPHVQRVNRSWSQCADMRAQRLRSLGFCVVKCDNRGSSRRGMAFESAIARRLGRLEVLDQVATVRHLILRGIADPTRVGIYGWSYGGYLSAMCLCRAPDVFHVAVAGAPVTSWDGYDTHYTERYMGLPADNPSGYRESAVFDHVPNMRGRLMIVHGLIDENVHFRHTARLINRLIGAGKDYDLLIFPDERHSPRRLRDRIYMEQRISDYFLRYLGNQAMENNRRAAAAPLRTVAGHL